MKQSSNTSLPISITLQSDSEAIIVQHALALYRDTKALAKNAPHGQFLNVAEAAICKKGRDFLNASLQEIVQEEVNEIEKKTKLGSAPSAERRKGIAESPKSKSKVPPEP
jgi:hypothetical protein